MKIDLIKPRPVSKLEWAAHVPFPRSTWIHPYVPEDDYDRVCANMWAKPGAYTGVLWANKKFEVEVDRDKPPLETPRREHCTARAEELERRCVGQLVVGLGWVGWWRRWRVERGVGTA